MSDADEVKRIAVSWPENEVKIGKITESDGATLLGRIGYQLSPEMQRTKAGLNVATQFLWIFAGALLGLLAMVVIAFYLATDKLNHVEEAVDIFKTTLATFASLLAFVMGYYFGQNPPATNNSDKKG